MAHGQCNKIANVGCVNRHRFTQKYYLIKPGMKWKNIKWITNARDCFTLSKCRWTQLSKVQVYPLFGMNAKKIKYFYNISILAVQGNETNQCKIGMMLQYNASFVCYWLLQTKQHFAKTQKLCENDNGSLALVPDENTLGFLNKLRDSQGYVKLYWWR